MRGRWKDSLLGHGPEPEKYLFFVVVATFWRQAEYT